MKLRGDFMKKVLVIILTIILISTLFTGCNKTEKLTEGKDNEKLVGAWIIINETPNNRRSIRYWEFQSDNTIVICDYVQTADSDTANVQLYEKAPLEDAFKEYYIKDYADKVEKYTYSYTDGYGLEYQKSEDFVVTFTEKEGWHFEFINENKFILTTDEETFGFYSEYHGYRLKEPLL